MNHPNIRRLPQSNPYLEKFKSQHIDSMMYNIYTFQNAGLDIKINGICFSHIYKYVFEFTLQRLEISYLDILLTTIQFSDLKSVYLCRL